MERTPETALSAPRAVRTRETEVIDGLPDEVLIAEDGVSIRNGLAEVPRRQGGRLTELAEEREGADNRGEAA